MTELKNDNSSVQDLIDRIRDQGVQSANREASRILDEAEAKASRMLDDAQKEIELMRSKAAAEIESERKAALEALKLSARDTVLQLKNGVAAAFETFVKRLVTSASQDRELVKNLVLVLAGHSADEFIKDKNIQILLSDAIMTGKSDEKLLAMGKQAILGLSSDMLREGVELIPSSLVEGGAKVRLVGEQLEIDLTDKAISKMLAARLLPRFQNILTGVE
ncbi:MAG: hypothetical protein ACU83O_12625 [Gammaproteobacteria bacterium]